MKMISVSKKGYAKLLLNSNNLPNSYNIEKGLYDIEIVKQGTYIITSRQPSNNKTIKNIENFIDALVYAAKGYTDCTMQVKKYTKLLSCFTDYHSGDVMVDIDF